MTCPLCDNDRAQAADISVEDLCQTHYYEYEYEMARAYFGETPPPEEN
jgi:hypothetical protein